MRPDELFTEPVWERLTEGLKLSPQLKCLGLNLLCGHGDKEIALKMGIAISTVRSHLDRLYIKLNVNNRYEVMIFFLCRMRAIFRAENDGSPSPPVRLAARGKREQETKCRSSEAGAAQNVDEGSYQNDVHEYQPPRI
jgi:hypothetical protein